MYGIQQNSLIKGHLSIIMVEYSTMEEEENGSNGDRQGEKKY